LKSPKFKQCRGEDKLIICIQNRGESIQVSGKSCVGATTTALTSKRGKWSGVAELHPLHLHSKYFKSGRVRSSRVVKRCCSDRIGHRAAGFSTGTASGQYQPPASL